MSIKVKERLRQLAIEMTHEQRMELDAALEKVYLKAGGIIIKKDDKEKACDQIVDQLSDNQFKKLALQIKKKVIPAAEEQAVGVEYD